MTASGLVGRDLLSVGDFSAAEVGRVFGTATTLKAEFRQPFDLLAETTMIAAEAKTGETAKSAKTEIWLGNLDSNQDRRSQSPLFYH